MPAKPDTARTLLRQWEMLQMIPRHPRQIPAGEIASRLGARGFEVTKRTVERDLNTLGGAFPITANAKSRPFGWQWARDARPFDVLNLSATEALAFLLVEEHLKALLPGSVAASLQSYFQMARRRLSEEAAGGAGKAWLDRVRIVPPTQPLIAPKVAHEVQVAVTDALLQDRQLRIHYRTRGSPEAREGIVHPIALVQRGTVFYLLVIFDGFTDSRTLALHRIAMAEILEARAVRPLNFDLDKCVNEGVFNFGDGKTIKLVAMFEEGVAVHLAESPLSKDQTVAPATNGWAKVSATVAETPQLLWWLLGFGAQVEVLKPLRLRNEIERTARAMGSRYCE